MEQALEIDEKAVGRFAEHLRQTGKQPATIESYCRDARQFAKYLLDRRIRHKDIGPETLEGFQDYLRVQGAGRANSRRRAVIGVRQFFRFLEESKAIAATPFDEAPIPGRQETKPQGLIDQDVEMLLAWCHHRGPAVKAARDAAIVSLLAFEGIKANELIALGWTDLTLDSKTAVLRIAGLRGRIIDLAPRTQQSLREYKSLYDELESPLLAKAKDRLMFIAFKGPDAGLVLPHLTRHGLKFMLYEIGAAAELPHLNTETLRHFAVNHLLRNGAKPEEVMQHLGLRRLGNIAKHMNQLARSGKPRTQKTPEPELD